MTAPPDAFDLWWQWATKDPATSALTIDAGIHTPVTALSPADRRDRATLNEAVRLYQAKNA